MKLQETKTVIESSGSLSNDHFGIDPENQSMILNILRSQLYSNKILAPIREYSCNGYDANVEAGTPDKPLRIKVPKMLDPVFSVRDFGPGLSENDIYKVYTKYGKSTKRGTNSAIGMLGIGSKSGFAYTDSFNITSFYKGEKLSFNAYLDESRLGKVVLLRKEPTTEPDGIEISFTVRTPDIRSFQEEAQLFFSTFEPRPEINISLPDPLHFDLKYKNWGLINPNLGFHKYTKYSRVTARMGNICYPIQEEFLTDITSDIQALTKLPIFIEFEIGDLSINASREALEYTQSTRLSIYKKLKEIKQELAREYEATYLSKTKDVWSAINSLLGAEAKLQTNSLLKDYASNILLSAFNSKYKGFTNVKSLENLSSLVKTVAIDQTYRGKINLIRGSLIDGWSNNWSRQRPTSINFTDVASDKTIFKAAVPQYSVLIVNDAPDSINRRLYTARKTIKGFTAKDATYIILKVDTTTDAATQKKYIESFRQYLPEGMPLFYLKDYEPALSIQEEIQNSYTATSSAPRAPTGPSAYAKAKVVKYTPTGSKRWIPAEMSDDPKDENIAVIVHSRKAFTMNSKQELLSATGDILTLYKLDPQAELFGIKKSQWEKMHKKFNIKTIDEKINELLEEKAKQLTVEDKRYIWYNLVLARDPVYIDNFYWSLNSSAKIDIKKVHDYYDTLLKTIDSQNYFHKEFEKCKNAFTIIADFIEEYNNYNNKTKMKHLIEAFGHAKVNIKSNYLNPNTDMSDLMTALQSSPSFKWTFFSTLPEGADKYITPIIRTSNKDIILDLQQKI